MNLAHRTIKNAIFNTVSWVLPLGINFVFTPYIVHQLGTGAYGILTLVWTIIGYFALLDLGLGNAVVKYVAEYNAEGSAEKTNDVIGATLLIFSGLGLIGGLVILSIARPLTTGFLKIPPELASEAYLAFCLGAAGFLVTIFLSVFSSIPNGLNRFDITSMVTVMMGALTTLGNAFLVCLGFGLIQIVILNVLISLAGIIAYTVISKKLLPSLLFFPVWKLPVIKKVMNFGFFALLSRLSFLINYQADRIIVGALLGVSWVTYYVVPFMIVKRITDITVRIGMVIFPAISELQGHRRFDVIAEVYLTSSRVVLTVATAICLPLFVFGGRLLSLWMGEEFGEKASVVIFLIALGIYLDALTNIPTFAVDGLGRPKISGTSSAIKALLNLAVIIPLAKYMGINGVAAAFFISNLCVTPVFVWYVSSRVLQIGMWKLFREAYAKPLFAGLLTLTALIFFPQNRISDLPTVLAIMVMSSMGYFAVAVLTGVFSRDERRVIFDYFRMALKMI